MKRLMKRALRIARAVCAYTLLSPFILLGAVSFLIYDAVVFGWKICRELTDEYFI